MIELRCSRRKSNAPEAGISSNLSTHYKSSVVGHAAKPLCIIAAARFVGACVVKSADHMRWLNQYTNIASAIVAGAGIRREHGLKSSSARHARARISIGNEKLIARRGNQSGEFASCLINQVIVARRYQQIDVKYGVTRRCVVFSLPRQRGNIDISDRRQNLRNPQSAKINGVYRNHHRVVGVVAVRRHR